MTNNRIWVDGCFDFFHHGHAGALNQARALGDELIVGIHTDEMILANKGPVVMNLDERAFAVDACRWTSDKVTDAPYVTSFEVMDANGCEFVAHGDDITTDADGNDCYQAAKDAGRFIVFKRTPNISTTDLINRMLTRTTVHHDEANNAVLASDEVQSRFRMYATAADAKTPYAGVFNWEDDHFVTFVKPQWAARALVYTEGTFDLFHSGHIEFLKNVSERAQTLGNDHKVVVGLRSDRAANEELANGRPIMNTLERALCLLQCKYVDAVMLNLPFAADGAARVRSVEQMFGGTKVTKVARGCKPAPGRDGLVSWAAAQPDLLLSIPPGKYAKLNTETIIQRVLGNRAQYEERQRKKGVKALNEKEMEEQERLRNSQKQS